MATVTERWRGKGKSRGNYSSDTALRIFDVIFATSDDDAMDAVKAMAGTSLWPAFVGASYDSTGTSILNCSNIACRDVSIGVYEVTATYGVGNFVPPEAVTSLPWKYDWKNVTIEVPFDRDINGHPIVNSARDPFSTLPTKRISYKSLRITRFEPFYNYRLYRTYENTVNSDTISLIQPDGSFTQFGPGTIFCVSIQPAAAYTQLDNYLSMCLDLELWDLSLLPSSVSDPFQFQALDQGTNAFYSSTAKGQIFEPKSGLVSTDQGLNGFGIPVNSTYTVGDAATAPVAQSTSPPGSVLLNPTSNAYYLKYLRYQSNAFIPLLAETPQ